MDPRPQRIDVTRDIYDSGILTAVRNPSQRQVLLYLAWRAGSDPAQDNYRSCYPKQTTIAEQCGLNQHYVRVATAALVELGVIERRKVGKLYHYRIAEYTQLCELRDAAPIQQSKNAPCRPLSQFEEEQRASTRDEVSARGGAVNNARGGAVNSARGGAVNNARGGAIRTTNRTTNRTISKNRAASTPLPLMDFERKQTLEHAAQGPALAAAESWQQVLHEMQLELPESTYETWLRNTTTFVAEEDGEFIVRVENAYVREWLAGRLRSRMIKVLNQSCGRTTAINFVLADHSYTPPQLPRADELDPELAAEIADIGAGLDLPPADTDEARRNLERRRPAIPPSRDLGQ